MSLEETFKKLEDGIDFVNELIADAHKDSVVNPNVKSFIIESAFLKMFIYWEGFLEDSLIKYLSDKTEIQSKLPLKYIAPIDEKHAQSMIIGTKTYIDWANVETVKKLCNIYIEDGVPFNSTLSSIQETLTDLKAIRNNTAHVSSTTLASYLKVVRKRIPGWKGDNMPVNQFLMTNAQEDNALTILQIYQRQLLAAGEIIKNCEGY